MSGRSFRAVRSALLLAVALIVVAVPAAQAAPKGVVGAFGDFASGGPRGIAVNETSGEVYAADGEAHRIVRLDATGTLLSEIGAGGASSANGRFDRPNGVAVDQSDGSLWVVDSNNLRVQRFDPLDVFDTHPFDRAIGWDVIDGGGTDFEVCLAADTCKAGVGGSGDGQFQGFFGSFAGSAAVTPTGDVYVSDPANSRVQRFDSSTGAFEAKSGDFALFGFNGPTGLAADADGTLYAVGDNNRVLRCNPTGAGGLACTSFASTLVSGNNPLAVAVDRDSGRVFVAVRPPVAGVFDPAEMPIHVLEIDPAGDLVDRHLETSDVRTPTPDNELPDAASLAVNSSTDTIYLSLPRPDGTGRVLLLGDVPGAASATLDAATGVTADSATFSGIVNPGGAPTGYRFEYRIPGAAWTRVPAGDGDLGNGAADVPVTETVSGLHPSTTYELRLVANRTYGTDDVATPVQTFTTADAPPEIGATRVSADDTTATFDARIDAQGSPTTYRFEYGTDASYGEETPERDGGDRIDPVRRYETVTGLQPNTTYHFRAVATNAAGTVEGPDRTFTTDATATPPSGRAYELVTPAGGVADVRITSGGLRSATPDGNHVCIVSPFGMAGADPAGGTLTDDAYCMHRSSSGWSTEWVSRPRGVPTVPLTATGARFRFISPDGSRVVFTTHFKGLVPERPALNGDDAFEGYLRSGGATTWVTPTDPLVTHEDRPPLAASEDVDSVVFHAGGQVHEWTPQGVRVVSVDQGGTPQAGAVNMEGASQFDSGAHALPSTVSRDGSRIFFQSSTALTADDANALQDVYMREDGTTTLLVSPRRGPGPETEPVAFAGASDDGDVVFLRTTGQLTNDAITGTALYRYDVSSDELQLVEDGIERSLGVSGDGSTVVFAGTNVLSGSDGLSLYAADGDGTVRIGPLASSDMPFFGGDHRVAASDHARRGLRITADGDTIVYHAEADTPGTVGVYRWTEAGGLEVVSDRDGTKVAAMMGAPFRLIDPGLKTSPGRSISDDGQSVFFETEEALDTRDKNSAVDVYEWRDGRTRLVSPGRQGDADARYLDSSADGGTVFFTTYERILPGQDINHARDIYAARRGGGFPEPPASTIGDPPAVPPGGSEPPRAPVTEGEGDQVDDPRPSLAVARPRAAALRAAGRSGRLPLRVRLTGGGKVTVRATAVLGGKRRVVARGSRTVRRERRTTATVTLRLSNAARRALRRRGRLRLRIEVVGSRALDDAQLTVVLRNAKGGR